MVRGRRRRFCTMRYAGAAFRRNQEGDLAADLHEKAMLFFTKKALQTFHFFIHEKQRPIVNYSFATQTRRSHG